MRETNDLTVLFPVWELEPFLKVGGLGEVARSLPHALKLRGVDIRLILPRYKAMKMYHQRPQKLGAIIVLYGDKWITVNVLQISFLNSQIPVYLLSNKKYFDKPVAETFSVFAGAVVELLKSPILKDWNPEIVHCNDNHCGLIPLLIKTQKLPYKTLLTIHCVSHQRKSPQEFATNLGIPVKSLSLAQWESPQKQLNFLLEGIKHADYVNTVSPTYLREIQTEELGNGLDDVILSNISKISAILNGIDYERKNPETDQALWQTFTHASAKMAKRANKIRLQKQLRLPPKPDVTLISFVGRMDVRQKGIEVLHRMLWREQFDNCQFVIMGHGQEEWENKFNSLASFLPNVSVITKYDDGLASLIYGASDFVLIPSHFEPCCLIQMNAMRYGAIPIARATGGLSDTVTPGVNGLLYLSPTARELKQTLLKAIELKRLHPEEHESMVRNAMKTDFSWVKSAQEYIELYLKMLKDCTE